MPYCHHCGKKSNKEDSFCESCGRRLKEIVKGIEKEAEDIEEEAEEIVEKTSYKGLVIFIIFLIIIGYIILDIWAMSQLIPVFTFGSVLTSISNFQGDVSLSKTSMASTIRIENPTFVPILFGRIAYDANYGDTKIAEGKTGFFIMAPNSQQDIPVDLTINNINAAGSLLKGLWNTLTGKTERKYINVYVDIGITKFKINTIE